MMEYYATIKMVMWNFNVTEKYVSDIASGKQIMKVYIRKYFYK